MPLKKELLDILACPECKVSVKLVKTKSKETLVCSKCKRVFPIIDGIPHMLPKN